MWLVTRSVTRLLTSDVSVVPLRLRRNAELRFVGHIATGRDTWDAVAGSKPSGRTWDLARLARMAASSCFRRLRSTPVAARDRDADIEARLSRVRSSFGNRDGGRSTKHDLTSSRCAVVQDRRPHPPLGGKKTVPYAVIIECRSLAPLRHHQLPSWSGTRDGGGQTVTCAEGHPRRPRGRRPGRTATDRPGSRHSPPRASPCRSRG